MTYRKYIEQKILPVILPLCCNPLDILGDHHFILPLYKHTQKKLYTQFDINRRSFMLFL